MPRLARFLWILISLGKSREWELKVLHLADVLVAIHR